MLNQFSRSALLYGEENLAKLANFNVLIVGIGGVGGYVLEGLIRTGITKITIIDDDKICLTNLNRQLHATHKTVGKFKVDVAVERALEINPKAEIVAEKLFLLPENIDKIDFSGYDYIVDAIDTVSAKIALIERAKAHGCRIISSMGAGNKLDPTAFEIADISKTSYCPLAKVMRKELTTRGIKNVKVVYSKEEPVPANPAGLIACKTNCICPPDVARKCDVRRQIPGSNAFLPSVMGLIIASEVVKDLIGDLAHE